MCSMMCRLSCGQGFNDPVEKKEMVKEMVSVL